MGCLNCLIKRWKIRLVQDYYKDNFSFLQYKISIASMTYFLAILIPLYAWRTILVYVYDYMTSF